MCRVEGPGAGAGFLDRDYFEDIMAAPFRDGTIAEAPVLPGTGLFIPAGSAAMKDKGLFRRNVPEFIADLCTGCMECALVCPDAAIPNTVHDIHDLLLTAHSPARHRRDPARGAAPRRSMRSATRSRDIYRREKEPKPFHEIVAEAVGELDIDNPVLRGHLGKLADCAEPLTRSPGPGRSSTRWRRRLRAAAASSPSPSIRGNARAASNASTSAGPHALVERQQDAPLLETLQARFEFLSRTPNTPARFIEGATKPDGDTKRLMLDRNNYYATTGGHGACRGCGEVTAIRLVTGANHAIHDKRRKEHIREVESLIAQADREAAGRAEQRTRPEAARAHRADRRERWKSGSICLESGPDRQRAGQRRDRQRDRLQQRLCVDLPVQPVQRPVGQQPVPGHAGARQGHLRRPERARRAATFGRCASPGSNSTTPTIRKCTTASSGLFGWTEFTPEELALLPTVISIGGDGATYDIGFGALSRLLTHDDADQGRGAQHRRLLEHRRTGLDRQPHRPGLRPLAASAPLTAASRNERKELALIAAFHPNVFVVQSSAALQGHFLKNVDGVPQPQRLAGGARRLHALPGRARHRRRAGQPPWRDWRWKAA